MPPIRVLIVDDAVVVRRMLSDVLAEDPEIEIAGVAANGRIALAKLPQVNPEAVILDVEMPEMGGLETLAAIRRDRPTLPVIMFSTLTERGAATTLDALALGATDYVTKPANVGSVRLAQQRVREELVPRLKTLCRGVRAPRGTEPARPRAAAPTPAPLPAAAAPSAVVIGVSTGGPNALAALLPALPAELSTPILVVQHMPPLFTRLLADRLDTQCSLRVREAAPGALVEPGTVWIAPGDHHMEVQRAGAGVVLRTHQGPPENSCRPAVDVLFRSAAAVYGPSVLAVVLTGMGQDGLRGATLIREAGGQILAQDEASSVVWGMPGYVAQAGLADRVLPLDQVAGEILRRAGTAAAAGARR